MRKKGKLLFVLSVFLLVSIFVTAENADALLMKRSLEGITADSALILTGKVLDIRSEWDSGKTTINTYVTMQVDRSIKGPADTGEVTVIVPGGTVGDTTIRVSDVATFVKGGNALIFLENEGRGLYGVTGWNQGKFTIVDDKILEKSVSVGKFVNEINNIMGKKNKAVASKDALVSADIDGWQDIMTEGFEGAFPSAGWTVVDNGMKPNEYYWGKDDYKPYSGSYSMWCARNGAQGLDPEFSNYPSNCESVAFYGPFDLSDAAQATWTFNVWRQTEINYDFIYYLVSINGQNWYGYKDHGDSGGWAPASIDLGNVYGLGNVCGQPNVWIAYFFESDSSVTKKGVFVDDIAIRKNVSASAPAIGGINPVSASAGTGSPVVIQGSNFGSDAGKVLFFSSNGSPDVEGGILSWSDTEIKCTVPEDASSGAVRVLDKNGLVSPSTQFTVTFGYWGVKWYDSDVPVPYYINETGTADCQNEWTAVQDAFDTWADAAGSGMKFSYQGTTARVGNNHNDGYNDVSWGTAPSGAIAVTYIRYTGDRVAENDTIFNNSYTWSDSGETGKFDVRNIATHEFGHWFVLSDLYGAADSEKTMYGFGATGETKKSTLEADDIAGAAYIYPAQSVPIIAADLDASGQEDVIIDFGDPYGIWIYYNNSTWQQLHGISAKSMTSGNLDSDQKRDLIIDFGPQYGIWIYSNNSTWTQLHGVSAESITTADLDNNGQDDIVVDFGSTYGIWIYYNNLTWSYLHDISPKSMIEADLDDDPRMDLIVDFGPQYGIWIYYNNSTWSQLHGISADSIVANDLDTDANSREDIIVDFGDAYGIWIYYNNSTWVQLHNISPVSMALSGNDSDLYNIIVDFGPSYGIWVYSNNSTWTQLHNVSADFIATGDMNGNSQDDVIVDFGPAYGVWVYYDNSSWAQLHTVSP